jgi:hypothetical protein
LLKHGSEKDEEIGEIQRRVTFSSCIPCEKRAAAQIAYLVFADTQANAEKTKRTIFLPTLDRNRN